MLSNILYKTYKSTLGFFLKNCIICIILLNDSNQYKFGIFYSNMFSINSNFIKKKISTLCLKRESTLFLNNTTFTVDEMLLLLFMECIECTQKFSLQRVMECKMFPELIFFTTKQKYQSYFDLKIFLETIHGYILNFPF